LLESLKVAPGLPIALQALARLRLAQGNAADAQVYAQELIQKSPADPTNRQLFAEALERQGQLPLAEQQILIAKQLAVNDSNIRLDLAHIYSSEKKWPEAQKEYEASLLLDPHSTTALGQFANFLMARNQSVQAIARVQQYVIANPADSVGHAILGALLFESNNYIAAQAEFERAIQLDPKQTQAYLRLGVLTKRTGRPTTPSPVIRKRSPCSRNSPGLPLWLGTYTSTREIWSQLGNILLRLLKPSLISPSQMQIWLG